MHTYSELSHGSCSPNTLDEPAKAINMRRKSLKKHRSRKFMHPYIPDEMLLDLLPFLDDTLTVGTQYTIYTIIQYLHNKHYIIIGLYCKYPIAGIFAGQNFYGSTVHLFYRSYSRVKFLRSSKCCKN